MSVGRRRVLMPENLCRYYVVICFVFLLVYPILPVSLACLLLLPLRYSVTFISMHVFSDLFIGFWNCLYDVFVFYLFFFFLLFIFFMTEFSVYLKKKIISHHVSIVPLGFLLANSFKLFDF
jgi:hypothetical protein